MKKLLFLFIVVIAKVSFGQVTITGSNGQDGTSYTSLTNTGGAFAALNAIDQSGKTIIITITADLSSETGINALTGAAGMWTSLTIKPSGARTVSASVAGALINLSGAKYVTIDGLNTGSNSLAITNTNTGTTASAIQFIADASNNLINNCSVTAVPASAACGVVFFSTGIVSGNDNNTISNCNINGNGGANNAIISTGSSAAIENSNNTISNCNIYDFFNATAAVKGIALTFSNGWNITGNSFYQTASRSVTAVYNFINIGTTSTIGFNITNNYFGGSGPQAGGGVCSITSTNELRGIVVNTSSSATYNSFQGNVFKNFSFTTSLSSSNAQALFQINSGNLNIGDVSPNIFGDTTITGSIILTYPGTPSVSAINLSNAATGIGIVNCQNNIVSGINLIGSSGAVLKGINAAFINAVTAGSYTITGNLIGSRTIANSFNSNTTGTVYGIYLALNNTAFTHIISNNTLANISANTGILYGIATPSSTGNFTISANKIYSLSTNSVSTLNTLVGINYTSSATGGATISNNLMYDLSVNGVTTAATQLFGIYYSGPTSGTNVISGNNIFACKMVTSSSSALLYGLYLTTGNSSIYNNIINLGVDFQGNSLTYGYSIRGIYEISGINTFYFNTVRICGIGVTGTTSSTYGYYSALTTPILKNNIFVNDRSGGATGFHYAIRVASGATIDYNDYYVSVSPFYIAYNGTASVTSLPILTAQDANSKNIDPSFINPNTNIPNLHISTGSPCIAAGTAIASITNDIDGDLRKATPDIGADEATGISVCSGSPATSNIIGATSICSGTGVTLSLSTNYNFNGITYHWKSSTIAGGPYTNLGTSATQATGNLTSTTYYVCTITCTGSGMSTTTTELGVTIATTSVGGIAMPTVSSICTGTGTTINLTAYNGSIQWQSSSNGINWSNITGETNASLLTANLTSQIKYRAVVNNANCLGDTSSIATVNIDQPNVGGNLSSDTSFCSTTNSRLLTLTANVGNIVRWESSINGGAIWTPISNTVNTYTANNVAVTTKFRVVVQTGSCPATNSSVVTITINTPPTATITGFTNPTVCGAANGTATVNSATSYSWNTTPVQTTQTATALTAGTYYVTISNGICSNSTSVIISDPSAPNVTIGSTATITCAGSPVTFTGYGATTYEFFINGISQGAATTSNTLTTTSISNGSIVTVRGVTAGCTGNSPGITMTVNPLSNGGSLNGASTVCSSGNNTLLTLNSYVGVIQKWQSSPNGTTWTDIANTTNTYTATNLTATTHYRAIVQSGICSAANSTVAIITVTPMPSATISYSASPYCSSLTTGQSVSLTGTNGGIYSAPSGLSINATTGAITPSTSTAGTYTVTYTIVAASGCAAVNATSSVTITAAPNASISYAGSPFCKTVSTAQTVIQTGTTGGIFSALAGLSLNSTSGAITPSTSTAGTYTVTYSLATSGGCAAYTSTTSVTITAAPSATISYSGSPYCNSVSTPQSVTLTGSSGGTFSAAPTGLSINAASGAITPSSSTVGGYAISYIISASGGCVTYTATSSVNIVAAPTASIIYNGTPFCKSIATAQPVNQTGTTGGSYTAPSGLIINATSGAITPNTSTAGTYTVTYTLAAYGGCSTVTTTTSVTITAVPIATISYAGSPFCTGATTTQTVTLTGTSGGTFSAAPTSLSINATTGAIIPNTSTPGGYTITYTIPAAGGCSSVSATTSVSFISLPAASGNITSIKNDSVSINENNALYKVPVIANSTSYSWSYTGSGITFLPSATTTTDSVRINFGPAATSGNLTVKGQNSCGFGTVSANYYIWVSPVGVNDITNNLICQIYPNPTKGVITINIKGMNSNMDLEIITLQGKLIRSEKLLNTKQNFTQDIDLSMYPRGVYFVKLINKNFIKVEKIVLQ
ncbi:MAG: T9SS type A sorting domain-containing protein [Bacteroidetes bacterium]|nr:T9SS type A sorting domain-containing protein [Bacteroidota bacterium]